MSNLLRCTLVNLFNDTPKSCHVREISEYSLGSVVEIVLHHSTALVDPTNDHIY